MNDIELDVGCAYVGFTQESTSAREILKIIDWSFEKKMAANVNVGGFNLLYLD